MEWKVGNTHEKLIKLEHWSSAEYSQTRSCYNFSEFEKKVRQIENPTVFEVIIIEETCPKITSYECVASRQIGKMALSKRITCKNWKSLKGIMAIL